MKHYLQELGSIPGKFRSLNPQKRRPSHRFAQNAQIGARSKRDIDGKLSNAIEQLVDEWLEQHTESITAELTNHFASLINKGIQEAYDSWNERLGTNFTRVAPIVARVLLIAGRLAISLARSFRPHILRAIRRLIRKLNLQDKTEQQILSAVRNFLEVAQLETELADTYKSVGEHEAFEMGRLLGNEALGATNKAWITAGDSRVDAVCANNAAEGEIPIRGRFSSGHLIPPAHIGCRCTAIYFGVSRRSVYWASRT